ncbi:MAG: hypothetical protein ABSD59_03795 [Terracidiphilus sp.]|jgi:hypothetical protein
MKSILRIAFAIGLAAVASAASATAQTVVLDGLGSSAYFLQAGLGASYSGGAINAPCVWSEKNGSVVATDTSTGTSLTDSGNAWVAWTKGSDGTCATAGSIYAYLQTDSVVGNRCLFNSNLSTRECFITYPTTPASPAGLILGASEVSLPSSVVTALNSSTQLVNYAGTDIRPEDAEFAITRALTGCGTPVATGSQYLGLGYSNGGNILGYSGTGGSSFHVISFSLPSSAPNVTVVGATPIVVAVNDNSGTGFGAYSNISSQALANFLDGTYSYTGQVASSPSATGSAATVFLREPLSGTYNTMEYNVPNRVGPPGGSFATSQDVGLNQPSTQVNCPGSPLIAGSTTNPLFIETPSGGSRQRAIGTGKELAAVVANSTTTGTGNSLGYSFWSAANFAGFSGLTTAKYYTVDGFDPLGTGGTIPTTSTQLASVSLSTTANGTYPIWSLLRLVNVDPSVDNALADLASATDDFVSPSHPDFVAPSDMNVVRSHFTPPAGSGLPDSSLLANGDWQLNDSNSNCFNNESGGDVGGVIIGIYLNSLTHSPLSLNDNSYCTNTGNAGGQVGYRR